MESLNFGKNKLVNKNLLNEKDVSVKYHCQVIIPKSNLFSNDDVRTFPS
jgi:hypothetical protein